MLATVHSATLIGIDAHPVEVEVHGKQKGELKILIVGLPDAAVKESQDRVWSALTTTGFSPPLARTTINLAPGNIRKEGPLYDLPIALGILAATDQIGEGLFANALERFLIAGELSLAGGLRPIKGGLAMAMLARRLGKTGVLLPQATAEEAALVEGISAYGVNTLDEAVRFLEGNLNLTPIESSRSPFQRRPQRSVIGDFSEVKGQHAVRRAVEIAVAGFHNILLIGSPGSGKSMIAKRIPTIMPEPSLDEFLEILAVKSAAGISLSDEHRCFQRPFRSPHHTISEAGLIGGGSNPAPGEISLAHNGVLFLDELPEFKRSTLEVLRQPLEDGKVTISRSMAKVTLPSSVMLVAAMNPTPGGYSSKDGREVHATPAQIARYRSRISGPLLDRIDIHVEAPSLSFEEVRSMRPAESSAAIRQRVEAARAVQARRFAGAPGPTEISPFNARMSHAQIREHCAIDEASGNLLQQAMEKMKLSARAYDRILKVARTIADLADADHIGPKHLLEAIQFRNLDRQLFH